MPVNFGFVHARVLQDAPDTFSFGKGKSSIYLIMWQIFLGLLLSLVTKTKPQENFLREESRIPGPQPLGWGWSLVPLEYSSKVIFAK